MKNNITNKTWKLKNHNIDIQKTSLRSLWIYRLNKGKTERLGLLSSQTSWSDDWLIPAGHGYSHQGCRTVVRMTLLALESFFFKNITWLSQSFLFSKKVTNTTATVLKRTQYSHQTSLIRTPNNQPQQSVWAPNPTEAGANKSIWLVVKHVVRSTCYGKTLYWKHRWAQIRLDRTQNWR